MFIRSLVNKTRIVSHEAYLTKRVSLIVSHEACLMKCVCLSVDELVDSVINLLNQNVHLDGFNQKREWLGGLGVF